MPDNSWNDPVTFKSGIKGRIKQHSAFRWAAKLIHDSTVVKSSSRRNEGQFHSSLNSCMTINISSNRLFQQRSSVLRLILASSFSSATRSFFNGSRRAAHACFEYCSRVNILARKGEKKTTRLSLNNWSLFPHFHAIPHSLKEIYNEDFLEKVIETIDQTLYRCYWLFIIDILFRNDDIFLLLNCERSNFVKFEEMKIFVALCNKFYSA